MISKGYTFLHDRFYDLSWKPAPGQRYSDGPKAMMRVTTVRGGMVYYTYADDPSNHGVFSMPLIDFMQTYGNQ